LNSFNEQVALKLAMAGRRFDARRSNVDMSESKTNEFFYAFHFV